MNRSRILAIVLVVAIFGGIASQGFAEQSRPEYSESSFLPVFEQTPKNVGTIYGVCTDKAVVISNISKYHFSCRSFFHGYLSGLFVGRTVTLSFLGREDKMAAAKRSEVEFCYVRSDTSLSYEAGVDRLIDDFISSYEENPLPEANAYEYIHMALVKKYNCPRE